MLKLFNTQSREKELVHSHNSHIKMYTCGPTIYDFAHIGNFRTYVFEDLLRRAIQHFGFKIEQAMNITDIDDKTIRGALARNIPLKEYTEPFKTAFFEDLDALNIQRAEHYPAATDYIPEMIQMIEQLLEKGYAYKSPNGSIYFSIRQFSTYGRLSRLKLADLKVNASGDNQADEYDKDNISDFVLWKAFDPERDGKIFWESPFGKGRPGWHIECSAMANKILGETIDIHCGGVDNMFPHHENEIAQSECCSGQRFVYQWVHVEHLLVDHKKMSKSLGNFYTLRDLLQKGYSGSEVRYLLLSTHYRTQLNFTFAGLDAARSSLQRIEDLIERLRSVKESKSSTASSERAKTRFDAALADDLNISSALAALFDFLRELNVLADQDKLGVEEAREALKLFEEWDKILGVLPLKKKEDEIPVELTRLLEEREKARKEKNFKQSDAMRDAILSQGYVIEDTPKGARLKKL
ncbi:MAG: cysteine--tRNA ligase [Chlamydiae bacterium CG10_big_fil_rev_8_21_14_0_10_42_34]|nr:MAG: cysteine--tRNA ligase [Chlamydiae bacterium CG10_big_fil_rev_8_21_14_0_10_42_34]